MRIRVPGRFIAAWAILAAFLFLLPASTNVANARPIGWEDVGPVDPDPRGDNDGVVLKGRSATAPTTMGSTAGTAPTLNSARNDFRGLRLFLSALRLDYWLFWAR